MNSNFYFVFRDFYLVKKLYFDLFAAFPSSH